MTPEQIEARLEQMQRFAAVGILDDSFGEEGADMTEAERGAHLQELEALTAHLLQRKRLPGHRKQRAAPVSPAA